MQARLHMIHIPEAFRSDNVLKYFRREDPVVAGVSGGRTSALMHILTLAAEQPQYTAVFANTGKEHEKTLEFLSRLETATAKVHWLELRKPARFGDRPMNMSYAEVSFETANRTGQPFVDFLETLAEFREATKKKGPVAPAAFMRICTAYMKVKVQNKFSDTLHPDGYTKFVGLRADEPQRYANLIKAETENRLLGCPLYSAGITKRDVLDFWKHQEFDLEIPEHLGNCNKCFLKDQADIVQSYYEEPWDGQWWLDLQERFGDFRRGGVPMRQLFEEAPVWMDLVRPAVQQGLDPVCPPEFPHKRFRQIVKSEKKRLTERPSFSCVCESAQGFVDED